MTRCWRRDLLVGRDGELTSLEAALDIVETQGTSVLVVGEPGIGKSELLVATGERARARGMTVLGER